MRVVQTVFGVYHHFDLARQLEARKYLSRIYSTWPWARLKREGILHSKVKTFPWMHTPEYLLHRAGLMPKPLYDAWGYANVLLFDQYVTRTLPDCDALIAISGSSLKAGKLVQSRGGVFLCDRGSTHQRFQEQLVSEEYARWGLHESPSDIRDTLREEEIYRTADGIVVPSTFSAGSFISMGLDEAKVHVVPYGVRLEKFSAVADPPPLSDRFEVLFAGQISLRKGVPYLLEAFSQVSHPNKRLRIAGGLHSSMKDVINRLPLDKVELLGSVPQEELIRLMSSSHLLVLPSIEEGLALVQGQALACGCPVLATPNSGADDLFTNGVEGFVVPIRDVRALRDRMEELAGSPELYGRMREAALQRVKHLGGWDAYGDSWERLLQRLTGQTSVPFAQ